MALEAALREQGGEPASEPADPAARRAGPDDSGERDLAAACERAEQLQAELAAVKDYARSLGAKLTAAQAALQPGARAGILHLVLALIGVMAMSTAVESSGMMRARCDAAACACGMGKVRELGSCSDNFRPLDGGSPPIFAG